MKQKRIIIWLLLVLFVLPIACLILYLLISIYLKYPEVCKIVGIILAALFTLIAVVFFIRKNHIVLPHKYYKTLDVSKKIHFWTITSSCFVAVFTFWWGIVLQFLAIDSTREVNGRLAHIQYVNEIYPTYKEYIDSCGNTIDEIKADLQDIIDEYNDADEHVKDATLKLSVVNKLVFDTITRQSIERCAFLTDSIFQKAKYYLPKDQQAECDFNILKAKVGLIITKNNYEYKSLEEVQDTVRSLIRKLPVGGEEVSNFGLKLSDVIWSQIQEGQGSSYLYDSQIMLTLVLEPLVQNRNLIIGLMEQSPQEHNSFVVIITSFLIMLIIGYILWILISYVAFYKKKSK